MTDPINTEIILKEILETLQRHSIGVNTFLVDISMLDPEFDKTFPHLIEYQAGNFYKTLDIKGRPCTILVKRRRPFNELIGWLQRNILPSVNTTTKEIKKEYKDLMVQLNEIRDDNESRYPARYSYRIEMECRKKDSPKIEHGNTVIFSVGLRQMDTTSYPLIHGYVGRLVDEESGGDFGISMVTNLFSHVSEAQPGTFNILIQSLPILLKDFKNEIKELLLE